MSKPDDDRKVTTKDRWTASVAEPDDTGHTWRRLYFQGQIIGMRCDACKLTPFDVLDDSLVVAPCTRQNDGPA